MTRSNFDFNTSKFTDNVLTAYLSDKGFHLKIKVCIATGVLASLKVT